MNHIQILYPRFQPAKLACLLLLAVSIGALPANAQIGFTSSELPGNPGTYFMEYVTSNANPSSLIGSVGGPQQWDFSYAEQPGDLIRQIDIVPTTDGGQQASFPNATYAERYTDEPDSILEWDYYSLTNTGRYYYGSYDPVVGASDFSPPPADIPAILGYGTNWIYTMSTTLDSITEQDTVSATVDAYGTVVLPQLGSFQALRVNQLTTTVELFGSVPVDTYYLREYYWLVPGFDKAVHIVSMTSSSPPPNNFTSAYEIRRVFEAGPVAPVTGLQISLGKGAAILNWNNEASAAGYQVQNLSNLTTTNWQLLATPASNSWSETLTATQRYYRVFTVP